MLAAMPTIPKSAPAEARNGGSSFSLDPRILKGLVAGAVIAAAIIALAPSSGDANTGSVGSPYLPNQVIPDRVGRLVNASRISIVPILTEAGGTAGIEREIPRYRQRQPEESGNLSACQLARFQRIALAMLSRVGLATPSRALDVRLRTPSYALKIITD
jgi:hypothetical protein